MLFVFTHVAAANTGRVVPQKKCLAQFFFFLIFIYEEVLSPRFLFFYPTSSKQTLAYQELAQPDTYIDNWDSEKYIYPFFCLVLYGFAKEAYAPPWT